MIEWRLLEERVLESTMQFNKPIGKTMIWACFEDGVQKIWKNSGKPIARRVLKSGNLDYHYGYLERKRMFHKDEIVEVSVFMSSAKCDPEPPTKTKPTRSMIHSRRTYIEPTKTTAGCRNSSDWHGPKKKEFEEES